MTTILPAEVAAMLQEELSKNKKDTTEVTTTAVSEALGISRHRAYRLLERLVYEGKMKKRKIATKGATCNVYSCVGDFDMSAIPSPSMFISIALPRIA